MYVMRMNLDSEPPTQHYVTSGLWSSNETQPQWTLSWHQEWGIRLCGKVGSHCVPSLDYLAVGPDHRGVRWELLTAVQSKCNIIRNARPLLVIISLKLHCCTQLSRCDAGVLSFASLLCNLLFHLSYHHTVYHSQCGKHMHVLLLWCKTVGHHSHHSYNNSVTTNTMHGILSTDTCSNIQQLLWCSKEKVQAIFPTQEVTHAYPLIPH